MATFNGHSGKNIITEVIQWSLSFNRPLSGFVKRIAKEGCERSICCLIKTGRSHLLVQWYLSGAA
eukprot:8474907-Karenia_brevis.AAC.1